ncbi:MAG: hypothetical protein ACI4P4_06345, partial [Faecousia sp.]
IATPVCALARNDREFDTLPVRKTIIYLIFPGCGGFITKFSKSLVFFAGLRYNINTFIWSE